MSGRAAMLGMGAAAGPPPSGDTYGDSGFNDTGSNQRLNVRTPVAFDTHSGAFTWIEIGDLTTYWESKTADSRFGASGSPGTGHWTHCSQEIGADAYAAATVIGINGRHTGPGVRLDTTALTGYWFGVQNLTIIEVFKGHPASRVKMFEVSSGWVEGDEVAIRAVGDRISLMVNDVEADFRIDTDYTGTYCGLSALRSRSAPYSNVHFGPAS